MSRPTPPPDATDPTAPSQPAPLFDEEDDATAADSDQLRALRPSLGADDDDRTELTPPVLHRRK